MSDGRILGDQLEGRLVTGKCSVKRYLGAGHQAIEYMYTVTRTHCGRTQVPFDAGQIAAVFGPVHRGYSNADFLMALPVQRYVYSLRDSFLLLAVPSCWGGYDLCPSSLVIVIHTVGVFIS